MFSPPHPGSILKEDILPELGISVTEAAAQLGIARETLSRVINGKSDISVDMAIRLEAWLNKPTAESWLHMQVEHGLWEARQSQMLSIELIKPVKTRPLIKSVLISLPADEKSDKDFPIIDKDERAITNLVGLQLKKARNMFGITVSDAAQHFKITEENLKRIEKEFDMEHIPLKLIRCASEFYNVSVDYLFGLNEDWEIAPEVRRERDFLSYNW